MAMQIITNNVPRLLLDFCQLTAKEQKEYDALECPDDYSYIRYRGDVYSLEEFMRTSKDSELRAKGWDGYIGESFFSAVLIKIVEDDPDYVVMGFAFY